MSTFLTKGELAELQKEGKLDLEMQIVLTNDDYEDFPIMISTDISTEERIYFSRCIDMINRVLADGLGEFPTGQIKWEEIANKILDPNLSIYRDTFRHIVERIIWKMQMFTLMMTDLHIKSNERTKEYLRMLNN